MTFRSLSRKYTYSVVLFVRPFISIIEGQIPLGPVTLHYITLHAEIYSARSYEEKIDRACIT